MPSRIRSSTTVTGVDSKKSFPEIAIPNSFCHYANNVCNGPIPAAVLITPSIGDLVQRLRGIKGEKFRNARWPIWIGSRGAGGIN
jgi:hypothetical protein